MQRFAEITDNEALLALIGALDARDTYRRDHASRDNQVAFIAQLLACFKLAPELKIQIRNAVLIHDIGMIGVPDDILTKPGNLSRDERRLIRSASSIAAKILSMTPSLSAEREMILHQNEHWDGSGYPDKLRGKEIPAGSRFISIAQAVDAMTHDRPYRRARPLSYCLNELQSKAGQQFDPVVAKIAAKLLCNRKRLPVVTSEQAASLQD